MTAADVLTTGRFAGYPFRTLVALAVLLATGVVLAVLPLSRGVAWSVTCAACVAGAALIAWHTLRLRRAFEQNAATLSALGKSTALGNLPSALRTRMPLVLVVGDALEQVFANGRAVHVGAGAIWLRVNKPRDLPGLALALKAWRGDRSPDGVVLTLTPDTHTDDTLTQALRAHRQALSDTARLLATRVPGYVAVYQRLTQDNSPHWFGLSATSPLRDVRQFEGVHASGRSRSARDRPRAA